MRANAPREGFASVQTLRDVPQTLRSRARRRRGRRLHAMARAMQRGRRMEPIGEFTLRVEQVEGFDFRVDFDKEQYAKLRMDEPAPLGHDTAPNPARVLAAAIGDCLSASLVFCLKRRKIMVEGLRSEVTVQLVRNERKRLRIGRVDVAIHPRDPIPEEAMKACLETFEDFCVVTQSVREGIDVNVTVTRP